LFTVVCGPCWAAHGGKPAAGEIGPAPTETAPLRYPDSQRQWLAALRRADWVGEIRVDGQRNLLAIARHLMLAATWETLESMPGWDTLMAKTGLGETTTQRWVQELKLRGWIVVLETGSTPLTRPMALALPDGTVLSRLDEGNRRAVYALRIPLSPNEALRWAADAIAAEALWGGAQPAAVLAAGGQQETLEILPATGSEQVGPGVVGDKKGRPTWSFPCREKTQVGGYAREGAAVDNSGPRAAGSWGINDTTDALRARLDEEQGPNWAVKVPTSGFEMLVAAGWLRHRLPVFARLTRRAVRALCRPFWAAGWSNLDIVHAMDHLPAAFGARAGALIGRGPGEHLDPVQAWWWVRTRLDAFHLVLAITEAGDQQEWDQTGGRIFLQLVAQFVAGAAGHDDIGKDQVRRMTMDFHLGKRGIWDGNDLVAAADEQLPHQIDHVGIVIHDQNSRDAAMDQELAHIFNRMRPAQNSCKGSTMSRQTVGYCNGDRRAVKDNFREKDRLSSSGCPVSLPGNSCLERVLSDLVSTGRPA